MTEPSKEKESTHNPLGLNEVPQEYHAQVMQTAYDLSPSCWKSIEGKSKVFTQTAITNRAKTVTRAIQLHKHKWE